MNKNIQNTNPNLIMSKFSLEKLTDIEWNQNFFFFNYLPPLSSTEQKNRN